MTLTYGQVHVRFTIPPILFLAFITRKFLVATECNKILLLSAIAVVYTTPWDNFIIAQGAWSYPAERVMGVVGYAPIEEYAFFIIQTVFTGLATLLVQRWGPPTHYLKAVPLAWTALLLFLLQFVVGITMLTTSAFEVLGWTKGRCFYMGALLSWTAPVLALQWSVAGAYILMRYRAAALSIWLPTIYLCWVDHSSIEKGVWEISDDRTLGIMVTRHLPLEEASFFFLVNCMIVFGLMAIDQTLAAIRMKQRSSYGQDQNINHTTDWTAYPNAWKIVLQTVIERGHVDPRLIHDAQAATHVLSIGSNTFFVASTLLPIPVAEDLQALYAFCRIADDLVDHAHDKNHGTNALDSIYNYIDACYDDKGAASVDAAIASMVDTSQSLVTLDLLATEVSEPRLRPSSEILSGALRHFARRVPPRVPKRILSELLSAFKWDVDRHIPSSSSKSKSKHSTDDAILFETEADLIDYCQRVAGSVGEACAYLFSHWNGWNVTRHPPLSSSQRDLKSNIPSGDPIIVGARSLGVSLQLINISRDMASDAESLHRIYIPRTWMDEVAAGLGERLLKDPWDEQTALALLANRMLLLVGKYETEARILGLPKLAPALRAPVTAALDMYRGIGRVLKKDLDRMASLKLKEGFPKRATLNFWGKLWVVAKEIIF
ncbi:hypothetical protein HDU97_005699 [Phlyctochytrium planicorne]|nr:hypothetical protein HDU97_005699 [Phlyctochytrium planicorne]